MQKLFGKIRKASGGVLGRPTQETMEEKDAGRHAREAKREERAREQEERRRQNEEEKKLREERRMDHEAIVQGLALGRVMWFNDVGEDLWFFIKNNDAVLGIFVCHEMHPYSRWKRAVVKVCAMFANFGLACLFLDYDSCEETPWCAKRGGDLVQAASAMSTVCVSVLLFCMYWFYTCRCARQGGPLHCGRASESCFVCCTKPIVCFFAALCLFIFGVGFTRHLATGTRFQDSQIPRAWALTEAYSFCFGICCQVCIFFSLYCGFGCCPCCTCCNTLCRECWGSGQGVDGERPSFAYPHGDDYPKDMELFRAGDRPTGAGIPPQNRLVEATCDQV